MTTYSPAAQYYVTSLTGHECTRSKWDTARWAYDAGHAAAYLEPATFTITEGHSPAAAAYAASRWVVDSNGYHEAAQAYDAALDTVRCICGTPGLLYDGPDEDCPIHGGPGPTTILLAPVPATTEPVRLTDPDDPRIKDGARAETRCSFTIGEPGWSASWVEDVIRAKGAATVYLLAEAPDPDADKRQAILEVLVEICGLDEDDTTDDDLTAVLEGLRERGVAK